MNFNIYKANHSKVDMIEDYISIFSDIFKSRGIGYKISKQLDADSINLVIDEFSDSYYCRKIIDFKDNNPQSVVIIVATEFIEKKLFVKTFNFFTGNVFDAAVISAMNVFFRIKSNHLTRYLSIQDFFIFALYSPFLVFDFLSSTLKYITKKNKIFWPRPLKHVYWLRRFLGLERVIRHVDGIIVSHDMISNELEKVKECPLIIGTLYPEIDINNIKKNIFKDKNLFIEITGTVTPYRVEKINEINDDISKMQIEKTFGKCVSIPALSFLKNRKRGAYSIHPPQTKLWKYASPTRIYRALCHDNNMPILTRNFKQHPIEDICLMYNRKEVLLNLRKYYIDNTKLHQMIDSKIYKYMEKALNNNDRIISRLSNQMNQFINK